MDDQNPSRPELLAPAGDAEALRAAVANGADAVYFGLTDFNARRRATNFTAEALPATMAALHAHNVRGYVALNTLILPDELAAAARCVVQIAEAGADAVIVQDLGLMRLIRRLAPSLPIHASTQATQTEPRGIERLRRLGVSRIILARELTLADIERIRRTVPDIGLEVFVHGALCVSYSGQCLASLSLLGRSANRGVCAQACRLPYTLLLDGRPADADGPRYGLSPKDLAAHGHVADLVREGVAAFKIEGRLKSPIYVAAATRTYREAVDAAVAGQPFTLTEDRERELAQGFSRGFTAGYLGGLDFRQFIEPRSPRSRGDRIGRVVGKTDRGALVEIDEPEATALKAGDGVVFEEDRPGGADQGGRVWSVRPAPGTEPGGDLVEIVFDENAVDLAAVSPGSIVWRTDDPEVDRRLRQTYGRDLVVHRTPLRIGVRAVAGRPLEVVATDGAGHEARAASAQPVEAARKHPLTVDLLREQFSRLGDTPFQLDAVELRAEGDAAVTSAPVMAPKSVLNDLRRHVVAALIEARERATRHAVADPAALDHLLAEASAEREPPAPAAAARGGLARSLEQADARLAMESANRPALVWCDPPDAEAYAEAVARGRAAGVTVGLATPRILMPHEEPLLEQLAAAKPQAILVRNLGALDYLREKCPKTPLVGDFSLNVTNALSVAAVRTWGLERIVPATDLDGPAVLALMETVGPRHIEIVAHQHVPLFHMAYCPAAAQLTKAQQAGQCGALCRTHRLELRDRNNVRHTILGDAARRCTVFGGRATTAETHLAALWRAGVRHFRVDLVHESPAEAVRLVDRWQLLLNSLGSS